MFGVEAISILAGGWSVGAIGSDLDRLPGVVLAVNDAAIHAPRVDLVCSMDRLWAEHRWPLLEACARPTWLRRSAVQNIRARPPWLTIFDCDHELTVPSLHPEILNGTSSGMCAASLALQLHPRTVYLFGFDMCAGPHDEQYWYEPPDWQNGSRSTSDGKYRSWSQQFAPLARSFSSAGIPVVNASLSSTIANFPKVDPRSVLV